MRKKHSRAHNRWSFYRDIHGVLHDLPHHSLLQRVSAGQSGGRSKAAANASLAFNEAKHFLHVNHLIEPQHTIASKHAINTLRHSVGAGRGSVPACWRLFRCVRDEHQAGGLDRLNQGGDHVLENVSTLPCGL